MTLTSILPTLRRSIPDPLRVDAWPQHTRATVTDLTVAGVSMLRLVELCQTPCVHSGVAVLPGTNGKANPKRDAAVIVVRVTAVLVNWDAERVVLIDACLDSVPVLWDQMRLIGRASTVKDASAVVLAGEAHQSPCVGRSVITLPGDLREGDLLAVPCAGILTRRDIRPIDGTDADFGERPDWLAALE
ncbi:hypothetical protein [Mycetocola zhujimingii]|uniref:Uncharacterized protein n=1 Tax=Mycetocola zhujimingii TaxID=2079792 RepID=A0A2U1TFL2_9MICO|nr:hypothetical protein [Mycetocola zhujimingii]PWC07688.1 hypothetical protein DF223_05230 [Mycetocola zhujimingii]